MTKIRSRKKRKKIYFSNIKTSWRDNYTTLMFKENKGYSKNLKL